MRYLSAKTARSHSAPHKVKKSWLCRLLLCGRGPSLSGPAAKKRETIKSLVSTASGKAGEGVKKIVGKPIQVARKDAKSQSKQRSSGFRIFAPWRLCVMAFHFFTASEAFPHSGRQSRATHRRRSDCGFLTPSERVTPKQKPPELTPGVLR